MMRVSANSDESSDSDDTENNPVINDNRKKPRNWYMENNDTFGKQTSTQTNQFSQVEKHGNPQGNISKFKNVKVAKGTDATPESDDDSDDNSRKCTLFKKKGNVKDKEKSKFKNFCKCCCRKKSETSLTESDNPELEKSASKDGSKKNHANKEKNTSDKARKEDKKERENKKKKRSKRKAKSKTKELEKTDEVSEIVTAGTSADITKSCCYLCTQNSMAIATTISRSIEHQTKGTQVSEKHLVRTVQSSVRVRTCEKGTDCPGSRKSGRRKFKLKKLNVLSKYMKMIWPEKKNVACGTDTPVKPRTKKTCGSKQCRRT